MKYIVKANKDYRLVHCYAGNCDTHGCNDHKGISCGEKSCNDYRGSCTIVACNDYSK